MSDRSDMPRGHWIDRVVPAGARPYLRLMRIDRPIGTWLLLLPGWWAIALAAPDGGWPDFRLLALFAVGAIVMRGAGCVVNDMADRDFDARVARTATRPIPSGAVSLRRAGLLLAGLLVIGLAVLLSLGTLAIWLGVLSLGLVALYPFMKRVTDWPQVWLGLTFNWGALLGWAAATGRIDPPALWLYAGGIAWTMVYDTIYAHQDKEDDALIGVRSTALLFGGASRRWLCVRHHRAVRRRAPRRRHRLAGLGRARPGGAASRLAGAGGGFRRSGRLPRQVPRQSLARLDPLPRPDRRPARRLTAACRGTPSSWSPRPRWPHRRWCRR